MKVPITKSGIPDLNTYFLIEFLDCSNLKQGKMAGETEHKILEI